MSTDLCLQSAILRALQQGARRDDGLVHHHVPLNPTEAASWCAFLESRATWKDQGGNCRTKAIPVKDKLGMVCLIEFAQGPPYLSVGLLTPPDSPRRLLAALATSQDPAQRTQALVLVARRYGDWLGPDHLAWLNAQPIHEAEHRAMDAIAGGQVVTCAAYLSYLHYRGWTPAHLGAGK